MQKKTGISSTPQEIFYLWLYSEEIFFKILAFCWNLESSLFKKPPYYTCESTFWDFTLSSGHCLADSQDGAGLEVFLIHPFGLAYL